MVAAFVTAMVAPATVAAPRGRFVARGEVVGPGYGFVTFEEWNLISCPEIPETQGLTSYFIQLPSRYAAPNMLVEAKGERLAGGFPLQMNFWSAECSPIEASVSSPMIVPAGTRFIEVFHNFDAAYTFELTVAPYAR